MVISLTRDSVLIWGVPSVVELAVWDISPVVVSMVWDVSSGVISLGSSSVSVSVSDIIGFRSLQRESDTSGFVVLSVFASHRTESKSSFSS